MRFSRRTARAAVAGALGIASIAGLAPAAGADTLVAYLYPHVDRGGTPYAMTHQQGGFWCSATVVDEVKHANLYLFDNKASSIEGFSSCQVKVFEHTNYGGNSTPYYQVYMRYVGAGMNDKASSAKVT